MRKPLEIWHLVITTVMFFIAAGTLVVNQSNRITRDEQEIFHLQESKAETQKQFQEVNGNLKDMNKSLLDIRILLEDKENRKN